MILTLPVVLQGAETPGGGAAPATGPAQKNTVAADKPVPAKSEASEQKPSDVEEKVEKLLGQLTQDEKMSMIAGDKNGYNTTVGVERLGIPKLLMSDGGRPPMQPCCVFPSAVALAQPGIATLLRRTAQRLAWKHGRAGFTFTYTPASISHGFQHAGAILNTSGRIHSLLAR